VLLTRLLTAAVGLPIVVALVLLGGVPFAVALALILAVGTLEFCHAAGYNARRPETLLGAALTAALVPAAYGNADLRLAVMAGAIAVALLAAVARADVTPAPRPPLWLVLPAALLWVGWLGLHLLLLRRIAQGGGWLLLLLLGVFATDTGAYAVGRLLGRHKLAPRVSPAKTVEGALGGLVCSVLACVALDYLLDLPRKPILIAGLGLALGLAAELGDLAESAVKRRLGVKDMGQLVPGHGGVLDRLDSVLFAGAVVYYIVRWAIL
jgi:phosphatidate cytidylyltransferase